MSEMLSGNFTMLYPPGMQQGQPVQDESVPYVKDCLYMFQSNQAKSFNFPS